ncbi:MAG: plastocyanin/azurin family copper-binding protein [Jatrophihabitans sp.]|uniref:plastocyanin/azurin family copper-binding protein n=1 Tax=Jatrophihabitans sp. TaxID=1932789 RepID=UPI003F7E96AE
MRVANLGGTVGVASLALGAAVVLSGCQTSSSANREPHSGTATASGAGAVQTVTLRTGLNSNDFRFHPSTIVVHPGKVRLVLVNEGQKGAGAPHNWSLTGFPGAATPLIQAGQRYEVTFTAPAPGRYQFVCTIHTRQGQVGTLVVQPS